MATVAISYGTRTEFPNDTNLNSIASNTIRAIGGVTNTSTSQLADGFKIDATVKLATTGVTTTGTLTFYLVESTDGTNYTDGVNITTTSDQSSSVKNAPVVYVAQANANSQIVQVVFDLPKQFAPKFFSLLVSNGSGASLSSTGHNISYSAIQYNVA